MFQYRRHCLTPELTNCTMVVITNDDWKSGMKVKFTKIPESHIDESGSGGFL